MNLNVAHCARLIFLALVMERWQPWHSAVLRERVAFEAQQIHLSALQQSRIRRTVRQVAGNTALSFYRLVLKYERPRLICMAFEADLVLSCGCTQLSGEESTVRIVAIGAGNQARLYAMAERAVELLLLVRVTGVTKIWLFLYEQVLSLLRVMRRVARNAGDIIVVVAGALKIRVLFVELVTRKAALGDVFAFGILEDKDLTLVASAIDVGLPRAMAGLATLPLRSLLGQRGSKVASCFEIFEDVFVTGLAGF